MPKVRSLMRIVLLNYVYDDRLTTAAALLAQYTSLTGWAEALAAEGLEVIVLQRFRHAAALLRNGVRYRFIADARGSRLRLWQLPVRVHREARHLNPDLVHVNGLLFPLQVRALRSTLGSASAIVVQHHAERPWSGRRAGLQRWGLRAADGFIFAAREHVRDWHAQGTIAPDAAVFEIMEASTGMRRQPSDRSRARTGLHGEPQLLWVGQLNQNKDPLAVLEGFEHVLQEIPRARLAMLFHEAPLLEAVADRITNSARLSRAVVLLGARSHDQLEAYYSSAEYFVLGSHYEGSGYALCEALACGVVPIVSDIPSFRMITGNGTAGALWKAGDASAFAAALRTVLARPWHEQSAQARSEWEARLSWPRIGHAAAAAYRQVVERRAALRAAGDRSMPAR